MDLPRHVVENVFMEIIDKAQRSRVRGHLLMNGRCPICNDGKTKHRTRFYLYEEHEKFNVFCHNCNYSRSFSNFLKEKFPEKYDSLAVECFKALTNTIYSTKKEEIAPEVIPSKLINNFLQNYFKEFCIKITEPQLDENKEKLRKYALNILIERNIPHIFYKEYFVCYKGHYGFRIILPFIDKNGLYYNFQARDIHPDPDADRKNKKYIFASFEEIELPDDKIYNRYNVDPNRTVYICEGIFKSLFINNSVALCNANVTGHRSDEIRKVFPNRVWILDSPWLDKTGYEATKKLLKMGETCFIMPQEHKDCKDLDELAKKLKVQNFDEEFIMKNCIKGEMGLLKLQMKCFGHIQI